MKPLCAEILAEFQQMADEQNYLAQALVAAQTDPRIRTERLMRRMLKKGLSGGLDKVYSGMEAILLRIVTDVDGGRPGGESWHQRLIDQVALAIPSVRPAILRPQTVEQVKELLKLRHRVRHLYGAQIRLARLTEIAATLPQISTDFFQDIRVFAITVELATEEEFPVAPQSGPSFDPDDGTLEGPR